MPYDVPNRENAMEAAMVDSRDAASDKGRPAPVEVEG